MKHARKLAYILTASGLQTHDVIAGTVEAIWFLVFLILQHDEMDRNTFIISAGILSFRDQGCRYRMEVKLSLCV